ncbi:MAG: hypothetical protein ACP5IT_10700 [Thermoproteota archaeon]
MKFIVKRSLNAVEETVTWSDVDYIYNEAINDFEELEKAKAECPFYVSPSLAKTIFKNNFEVSVKNRLGSPYAVAKEMAKHASDVILACAEMTSKKAIVGEIMKESGKNCFVAWDWSPTKGVCTLYKYDPLKAPMEGSLLEKDTTSCPHNPNAYGEANIKSVSALADKGWLDECLLDMRPLVSDVSRYDSTFIPKKMWNVEEEAKKWYSAWEQKWKDLRAKFS